MERGNITKEQELLLYVLERAINGESGKHNFDCDFSALDFNAFIKESIYQAVCYIAIENSSFLKPHISRELYNSWKRRAIKIAANNIKIVNAQNSLTKLLGGKYKYVILKGLASANYYPEPALRTIGDLDFLVDSADIDKIQTLLVKEGFQCVGEENDHHIVLKKPQSHLEMHFEIPGIPYGNTGDKIRAFMSGVFEDCVTVSNNDGITSEFCVPDQMRQGLILILHMQHHMLGEGLGLRHLMDWACFVNKTTNEPFWQELIAFFREIGIFTYAAAMTKTCALYLGSACPEWSKGVSDKLCSEIIADIFRLGNFGSKDIERSKSGALISEYGKDGTKKEKLAHLWKLFNISVKSRHKSLERYKILYPVFYVYEFFRYSFDVMRGRRPKLTRLWHYAEERKHIYDKLHVFEVKKGKK